VDKAKGRKTKHHAHRSNVDDEEDDDRYSPIDYGRSKKKSSIFERGRSFARSSKERLVDKAKSRTTKHHAHRSNVDDEEDEGRSSPIDFGRSKNGGFRCERYRPSKSERKRRKHKHSTRSSDAASTAPSVGAVSEDVPSSTAPPTKTTTTTFSNVAFANAAPPNLTPSTMPSNATSSNDRSSYDMSSRGDTSHDGSSHGQFSHDGFLYDIHSPTPYHRSSHGESSSDGSTRHRSSHYGSSHRRYSHDRRSHRRYSHGKCSHGRSSHGRCSHHRSSHDRSSHDGSSYDRSSSDAYSSDVSSNDEYDAGDDAFAVFDDAMLALVHAHDAYHDGDASEDDLQAAFDYMSAAWDKSHAVWDDLEDSQNDASSSAMPPVNRSPRPMPPLDTIMRFMRLHGRSRSKCPIATHMKVKPSTAELSHVADANLRTADSKTSGQSTGGAPDDPTIQHPQHASEEGSSYHDRPSRDRTSNNTSRDDASSSHVPSNDVPPTTGRPTAMPSPPLPPNPNTRPVQSTTSKQTASEIPYDQAIRHDQPSVLVDRSGSPIDRYMQPSAPPYNPHGGPYQYERPTHFANGDVLSVNFHKPRLYPFGTCTDRKPPIYTEVGRVSSTRRLVVIFWAHYGSAMVLPVYTFGFDGLSAVKPELAHEYMRLIDEDWQFNWPFSSAGPGDLQDPNILVKMHGKQLLHKESLIHLIGLTSFDYRDSAVCVGRLPMKQWEKLNREFELNFQKRMNGKSYERRLKPDHLTHPDWT
jgi:hypothetical protein